MAEGAEGRFAHLLQPLRDLAQSWSIDIASELESYLEELDEIQVSLGASQLNFIEAALVVQGSSMVYAKKVECLHALVYQALEQLTCKRKEDKHSKNKGPQQSIEDASHLLAIEINGGSSLLTEAEDTRPPSLKRMPLYLMPRDLKETKRLNFKITTCTLHKSMCLLEASDALHFDVDTSDAPSTPLLPPPPMALNTAQKAARLSEGLDPEPEAPAPTPAAAPAPTPATMPSAAAAAPSPADEADEPEDDDENWVDPWAPLDPHEVNGKANPLKVGNMSRKPPQRLLKSLEETQLFDPFEDSDLFEMGPLKSVLRRLGLEALQDLDHLVIDEMARNRKAKMKSKKESMGGFIGPEDETDGVPAEAFDPSGPDPYDEMFPDDEGPEAEDSIHDQCEKKASELEQEIEQAQRSYEDVVRRHLEKIDNYSSMVASDMPQLYANVRKWQDSLEPILKREQFRPKFDIHNYGRQIIGSIEAANPVEKTGTFAEVVANKPQWEVCRYFLAALVLTNNGNVDIAGNEDFLGTESQQFTHAFRLQVLDGDRPVSYDENENPDAGRKEQKKATPAIEDSPHPKKGKKPSDVAPEPEAPEALEAPKRGKKKAADPAPEAEPEAPKRGKKKAADPAPEPEVPKRGKKKAVDQVPKPEAPEPPAKKRKQKDDAENAPPNAGSARKTKKEVRMKEEPLSQPSRGRGRRAKA